MQIGNAASAPSVDEPGLITVSEPVRCRLSVVVPCYNEELNIQFLYERLKSACSERFAEDYEILLVNDGSKDDTWNLIKALAASDPRVIGVDLSRNHGHQLALSAGLEVCRGELIFILDADLQDPPELLDQMIDTMQRESADVVYGQRTDRHGESHFKKFTAALFYRLLGRIVDVNIPRDTGDFRLMNRQVLDVLLGMPERNRFIRGMVSWVGFKQVALPYERNKRHDGESHYPFLKMFNLAMDAITGFSTVPLRLASHFGLLFGFLALIIGGYSLVSYFAGSTVEGWTSLMAVVCLVGAVNLAVLGVIGEYLGRLYMESKSRPMFVIREVTDGRTQEASDSSSVSATEYCPNCKRQFA